MWVVVANPRVCKKRTQHGRAWEGLLNLGFSADGTGYCRVENKESVACLGPHSSCFWQSAPRLSCWKWNGLHLLFNPEGKKDEGFPFSFFWLGLWTFDAGARHGIPFFFLLCVDLFRCVRGSATTDGREERKREIDFDRRPSRPTATLLKLAGCTCTCHWR